MLTNTKICKNEKCKKTVKGRSDRVFCSGYCKSEYHYSIRKESGKTYFKAHIDDILRKNRSILAKFNSRNGIVVESELLLENGFNPRFFTHYWTNLTGETFYFCYDQGFKENTSGFGNKYTLVAWQKEMERQVML